MPVVTRSQSLTPPAPPAVRVISSARRFEILHQQAQQLRQILSFIQQEMNEEPRPVGQQRQDLLILQETASMQLEEIERDLNNPNNHQQRMERERELPFVLNKDSTPLSKRVTLYFSRSSVRSSLN